MDRGRGYELSEVTLSIGSFLVGKPTNRMEGRNLGAVTSRAADYQKEKSALMKTAGSSVDPVRLRVLKENWANDFSLWAAFHTTTANYGLDFDPGKLVFTAVFGGGAAMEPPANYLWGSTLIFSHWDPDTLCGRLNGAVGALHKSLLQPTAGTVYGAVKPMGWTSQARV